MKDAICKSIFSKTIFNWTLRSFYSSTLKSASHRLAIIGSGPAGLFLSQKLIKYTQEFDLHIDVIEKEPMPFGLVRFGVAPDHPEVKNVERSFTEVLTNQRVRFVGGIRVGDPAHVHLDELRRHYSGVVLAYGAASDQRLNIPGEDLNGSYSNQQVVGWYNGALDFSKFTPNFDARSIAIIGHGNVSIDVARILLTDPKLLESSDITSRSLSALERLHPRLRAVYLLGRRGPLHVAFTIAELRELLRAPGAAPRFEPSDLVGVQAHLASLQRPRKRLTELLLQAAGLGSKTAPASAAAQAHAAGAAQRGGEGEEKKQLHVRFFLSPLEILPRADDPRRVGAIRLARMAYEPPLQPGAYSERARVRPTGEELTLECDAVVRCVGYRCVPLDPSLPFDAARSCVPNDRGRVFCVALETQIQNEHFIVMFLCLIGVQRADRTLETGLYCVGWIKRGPVGVLVNTTSDAFETADAILSDLRAGRLAPASGSDVTTLLRERKLVLTCTDVRTVSFAEWQKIDRAERSAGEKLGKPREKLLNWQDVWKVLDNQC